MAEMNNTVIETAGLTKVFRDFWGHQRVVAVDSLDLTIRSKEVFGLLGPNGSGKSTTIKMLLGLLNISKGAARVLGALPGDVRTNARIGYLPEESYLYPFLNARETLDFYGRLFNIPQPQRQRRIDSLLEMVGLGGVARRPIGEYSKGMIRRIGLAQALINDPELLILDEPTSGMDPIGTRQIKDLICELGNRGKTVLLSSHLLADVEDVCDRICILYGGKVRSQGTVDEMLVRQEATQIIAPKLDESTLEKVEQVIYGVYPDYQERVQITTPRDRLEDVFLQVVSEAQAEEVETAGAIMGGEVSDFLGAGKEDAGQVVIEQLVSAGQPEFDKPQEEKIEQERIEAQAESRERQEVLDTLVSGDEKEELIQETEKPSEKEVSVMPTEPQEVDKDVIDNLLGKKTEQENDSCEDETGKK